MGSKPSPTQVDRFVSILSALTGITPYALGGHALVEEYAAELVTRLGKRRAKLLSEAAELVQEIGPPVRASVAAHVRRQLAPGADVAPRSRRAERVSPVTEQALALADDLATMAALAVAITGLAAADLQRTLLVPSLLLELRETHGAGPAAELLALVRGEIDSIQREVVARRLLHDLRSHERHAAPDVEAALSRCEPIRDVVDLVARRWVELRAFSHCVHHLAELTPDDVRGLALADRALARLRRTLPKASGSKLIASFAEDFDTMRAEKRVADAIARLARGRHAVVLTAAEDLARDLETFVAASVVLTGLSRIELLGTGLAATYLDQTARALGDATTHEFLERARSVLADGADDVRELDVGLRLRVLGDQKLGAVARAVMKLWYLGQWEPLPAWWYSQYEPGQPRPGGDTVVSAEAYKLGFAWQLAGAHPQGALQPGYASWSLPPAGARERDPATPLHTALESVESTRGGGRVAASPSSTARVARDTGGSR